MDRRDFARLSALALASAALPDAGNAQDTGKPVNYALIGLGGISDIFGRACLASQKVKVTALVTGHADTKGREWAAKYGVPESSIYTYESFDKIADNKSVDAVYIGLPNSMHREFTVRAAKAGKHVLCEKPMAISSEECREMITTCRKARVKLMIAYRCHYDPTYLEAERLIQSGAIGDLQSFEGAAGFIINDPNLWRLDPKLAGGGPLMDIGIYPLNAIRFFTREDPVQASAFVSTRDTTSGRFKGMEESMVFNLRFNSGILATVGTTYGANMPSYVRIHGTKGSLEISPAVDYTGIHLTSMGNKDLHVDTTSPMVDTFHFQLEAEHLAECIRTNKEPKTPGLEGLRDLSVMEAIYKAAGKPIA